jgi:cytochrome c oxidase assembly protein subunit 15
MNMMAQSNNNIASLEKAENVSIQVIYWLYAVAAIIFVMVLVGGATRLTDSGLSITEWAPIRGIFPPLSHEAWIIEFEKYRQIPEYQLINRGMSLSDFQFIFWWEWAHRFLGRFIGLVYFLPMIYFLLRGMIPQGFKRYVWLIFALGGLQGFLGWWMVASGLTDRVDVSPYRLAIHLTLACIIFTSLLLLANAMQRDKSFALHQTNSKIGIAFLILILIQIALGGLVAGLDAGLTYTTWPLMDGAFIPPSQKLWIMAPYWHNLIENPLTVQFIHRSGAYILWCLALIYWLYLRFFGSPTPQTYIAGLLLTAITVQAVIGIATLLMQVPLWLALLHQGGALIVLMIGVWHLEKCLQEAPTTRKSGHFNQALS